MKPQYFLATLFVALISVCSFAQTTLKTESINVSGNCKSCKKNIETAAKTAGASYANWNVDTKVLTVKYDAAKISDKKIETGIASAGYDTPDVKATDAAYKKLDDCCQYDRKAITTTNTKQSTVMNCCKDKTTCTKDCCSQKDMSCCKGPNAKYDCCKQGNGCCSK